MSNKGSVPVNERKSQCKGCNVKRAKDWKIFTTREVYKCTTAH